MPRFDTGAANGALVVDGIYQGLLTRERAKCDRPDVRSDPDIPAGFFRCRPRGLLDALEVDVPVVVGRRTAEMAINFRFQLPWDRAVTSVRVSPDDVVRPTEHEHPWYGCAAKDVERKQ